MRRTMDRSFIDSKTNSPLPEAISSFPFALSANPRTGEPIAARALGATPVAFAPHDDRRVTQVAVR